MSIPRPPIPLEGHCSTIVDETLYVLSPGGFQSLPLKKNAKWSKEPNGVKVTGPACVTVTPNGDASQAALWVIGGTSGEATYDGIQVYSFAQKTWQSITTPVPEMQDRTDHSAAWLQDQESILVYAGSQPDAPSALSSQTFVISTQPPYSIQAYTSDAPPANIPILQPWDSGSVFMVGGSTLNTEISIFSPEEGWKQLGTDLVTPLNPGARGVLVDGSDGSKVLEVYDMSVSPNTVTQIILLGAGGATASTGQVIGNGTTSKLEERGLRLSNWPPYHSHLAPTVKRTDFSVVQNPNGLAVISGGNNAVPVALFNQDSNAWVDAGHFFNAKDQKPLKPNTTKQSKTSRPTTSSSSSPSLAAGSSSGASNHDRTLRVLGIILGVLFGIAAIFVIVLFYLRVRKRQKREREGWLEEKPHNTQQTSLGDNGAFAKETGGTGNEFRQPPNTPWRQSKGDSHTSLGIITGKFTKRLSPKPYGNGHAHQGSGDSTVQLVKDRQAGIDAREPVELADIEKQPGLQRRMTPRQERSDRVPSAQYGPNLTEQDAYSGTEARANRSRSSGWSKYFATSAATGSNGLGHIPSAYVKTNEGAEQPAEREISQHSRIPSSALVPGNEGEPKRTLDGQPVSHVAMGSPSFNDSREDLAKRGSTTTEGQKGLIVDPNRRRSQSESISSYNRSQTSSARTSEQFSGSAAKPWSPTETTFRIPTGNSFKDHLNSRPTSSETERRTPSRGKQSPFFMGAGTGYRPPKSPRTVVATPSPAWGPPKAIGSQPADARDSNVTVWPGHRSNPSADYSKPAEQRSLAATNSALPMPLLSGAHFTGRDADDRESYVTVVPSAYYAENRFQRGQEPTRPARPAESDLAWLNLGLNNNSQTRI